MNALLLASHKPEQEILVHALEYAGLNVLASDELDHSLDEWLDTPADFLVVAMELPDPLAVIYHVRRFAVGPLVMIMDPVPESRHVELIQAGADWVVQRPYSVPLFISYTRAFMRRAGSIPRASLPSVRHERLRLDPSTRTVHVTGREPQRLSQLEFRLLHALMTHRGQVLPTEAIVEHVWGYTGEGDRSLVRGLINRLRTKVEDNPNHPHYIRTVARVGYTFGDDDEE